ncbi:MAG: septation protein IspZ [Gammaproteobacteria bacterium]|nr:septation protein IspZ [Gammaproteobacteria bacterium]
MKFLFDFGPIILFFVIYKTYGLYAAIYAMIAGVLAQLIYARYTTGKFENSHLITFGLLVVFGGVTLVLKDPAFIMWKVSVLYVIFSLALIGSMWVGKKTLIERMMGKELKLPRTTWDMLTWFWGLGFIGIAIINAYFVRAALGARDALFDHSMLDPKVELGSLDCASTAVEMLCVAAQQSEETWVDFKLFGTLGLTFGLVLLTVIVLSKHIKEKES